MRPEALGRSHDVIQVSGLAWGRWWKVLFRVGKRSVFGGRGKKGESVLD